MAITTEATAPAAPPARPRAEVLRRADGIELIGEFEDSGFKEPPLLARRGDGQVVQLTQLLYAVAEASDGHRDVHAVADAVSRQCGRTVTADNVAVPRRTEAAAARRTRPRRRHDAGVGEARAAHGAAPPQAAALRAGGQRLRAGLYVAAPAGRHRSRCFSPSWRSTSGCSACTASPAACAARSTTPSCCWPCSARSWSPPPSTSSATPARAATAARARASWASASTSCGRRSTATSPTPTA